MKKILALLLALCTLLVCSCKKKEANVATSEGETLEKEAEVQEIKIGCVAPLSGGVAVYGVECKNGIDLAIEELNAAGGIMGRPVTLIAEDDEGDPAKSLNAFNKLTTKDGIDIVIGSLTSGCTKAMTTRAQAKGVLQMAPAATSPDITDAGNFIYRACFIDPFQGTVGGVFSAVNLNATKAAVLYNSGSDYSTGLYENYVKAFREHGGEIVAEESYANEDKNFTAQLTKIKNASPDVVYLPDYYATVALIAKQLRDLGIDTPIVGADGWDGLTGIAGDEVLNGYYSNHYSTSSTEPMVEKFVTSFRDKYNKDPNSFAALGYDCVYLLRDAMERAGSTKASDVRAAMEESDGDYVTGHLTFDEKHNPIKSAVMIELVKGEDGGLTTSYKATVNP